MTLWKVAGELQEAKYMTCQDETAKGSEKCGTESVLWRNTNVVESPTNIKFGE